MKDLDHIRAFANAVVDQNRSVHHLADTRMTGHGTADVREALQEIQVVQNGIAKMLRGCGKVCLRIGEDFLEIR
jgi:hypothetical protein